MTDRCFKADWGISVLISTLIVSGVILAGSYWPVRMAISAEWGERILGYSVLALLLGIMLLSYLMSPRGYILGRDAITVVRVIRPIVIPLADITGAEEAGAEMLKGSTRLLGCHGLWGKYGKYHNESLGDYLLYVRKDEGLVVLRGKRTYVLAPENPAEFTQAVNEKKAVVV